MILGINLIYICMNSNFVFFVNVKSCFVMRETLGQIILRDSVIRKGIGAPSDTVYRVHTSSEIQKSRVFQGCFTVFFQGFSRVLGSPK